MENKELTPVEWLFQQLWDEPKDKFTWYALREKAIQMEKGQTELRYKDGSPMRKYNSPKLQAIEMENKQTAIQQMIDFINDINDNDRSEFQYYYDSIIVKLNELLEVEKEQLDNARPQIVSNCVIKELSDEEIREQAIKYDNQAFSETPVAHFMEGALWYREQLKKK